MFSAYPQCLASPDEYELASTMVEATLAMLLDPDPNPDEGHYDLLYTLALSHDVISDWRCLN